MQLLRLVDRIPTASLPALTVLADAPSFTPRGCFLERMAEDVEQVIQELLGAEITEHIGATPYERTATRNGHPPRTLRTRVGPLNLLVPQDREGTFSTRLFARYQRVTRRPLPWP